MFFRLLMESFRRQRRRKMLAGQRDSVGHDSRDGDACAGDDDRGPHS